MNKSIAAGLALFLSLPAVSAMDPPVLSNPRRVGGQFEFTLTGLSNSVYRIEVTTNFGGWVPVATNSTGGAVRNIVLAAVGSRNFYRAGRLATPYFRYAFSAVERVNLNGSSLTADSFNSADPLRSTNGAYDSAKASDLGDVAATQGIVNPAGVGNTTIYGSLRTGPGGGAAIGPNGAIGSKAWIQGGIRGIQPGHWVTNLSLALPPVAAPFAGGALTPPGGIVSGTAYAYVLDTGNYQLASLALSAAQKMYVRGHAILYVTGSVAVSGAGSFVIGPNASLRLYVGGANATFHLASIQHSGRPSALQYYGLPSNTAVTLAGGPGFTGTVHAPSATLTLGTGATAIPNFSGAFSARIIQLNSSVAVHFDEDLPVSGPAY